MSGRKRMAFIFLVVTLLGIAPVLVAQEAGQSTETGPSREETPDRSITSRVDKIFEKWDKPDSPGCALAVIRDGRVAYKRGYGMANLEYNIPITPSTVFNVASMSKQFAAAAIVLVAQQGKLSLDDDIRKYIPELPDFGSRITIRHLLHHTSGLRCNLPGLAGWRLYLDLVTEDDNIELLSRQKQLNFPPGDDYVYCNTGYELLALIVKRSSGQSLREFTRTVLFEPLGMKSSFFRDDHSEVIKNLASGYYPAKGNAYRASFPSFETVGATNLHTTVEDLALWDQNFYEPRVGGTGLIKQLHERATLNSGEAADYGYSFGSFIKQHRGLATMELLGGGSGYRAYMMRFPEQRFSVICLCNVSGSTDLNPFALGQKVVELYLAAELKQPSPTVVQLSGQQLSSKVGAYWNRELDQFLRISIADGKLQLVTATATSIELMPIDENRFRTARTPVEIRFEDDSSGRRPRLVHTWDGDPSIRYEPITLDTSPNIRLSEYVGTYINEEIDAIWRVTLENGKLLLKRLKSRPATLQPVLRDVFTGPPWTVRFTRDSTNQVEGFVLNSYFLRNFRFGKQSPK